MEAPKPEAAHTAKWYESPLWREIARIALAAAIAWLAAKGIKIPGETTAPPVVVVNTAPAHDPAK